MKKTLLILALTTALATAQAQWTLSEYDLNAPIGWGTVDGTITGSGDANHVTVTTMDELVSALSGTTAKTIYVSGELTTTTGIQTIQNAKNKTVYGLPGSSLGNTYEGSTVSLTGILHFKNCSNIILRNLTFKSAGAYDIDGNDNMTMQNCTYMWIDHCDFQDGVDGNLDCNNGSNYICVSWCRFRYLLEPRAGGSGGSDDHRFTNLWGGSDKNASTDGDKLNTTFVNCWWDEGCKERMPRVRFGKVHLLNCLYSSSVANYCAGGGYRSNIYIEGCYYDSKKAAATPWKCYATSSGYTDYNVTITDDNAGVSTISAKQAKSGDYDYFVPSDYYTYTVNKATDVATYVSDETYGAGATLHISEGDNLTTEYVVSSGSDDTEEETEQGGDASLVALTTDNTVVNVTYFTVGGRQVSQPLTGLNIVRTLYADGHVETRMILKR